MNKEIMVELKPDYVAKYEDGYPLLLKEAILHFDKITQEGSILNLFTPKKKFIAKAYHGLQNKGFGWILSQNAQEQIDTAYFTTQIQTALSHRESFYADKSTTAFRVFNGEGDGVGGFTIDYFAGYYMITWYSMGIYEYRGPILEALKSCVDYKGIYQ